MTAIIFTSTALAVALGVVVLNVYRYIKYLKKEVNDTEQSNESYLSALRVISKKQPGLVDAAFRESGEEEN